LPKIEKGYEIQGEIDTTFAQLFFEVNLMKFVIGFVAGVVVTGLLIDKGVNLPERLGRVINTGEVQQLWHDIGNAVKERGSQPMDRRE
jgi:hypothetical protein